MSGNWSVTATKIAIGVVEVVTTVAVAMVLDKVVTRPVVRTIMTPIKSAVFKNAA